MSRTVLGPPVAGFGVFVVTGVAAAEPVVVGRFGAGELVQAAISTSRISGRTARL